MSPPWRGRWLSGQRPRGVARRRFLAVLGGLGAGAALAGWWGRLRAEPPPAANPPAPPLTSLLAPLRREQSAPPVLRADRRPATYFLQAAGERAFASLLARLDAAAGYRPYFALDLGGPVPILRHDVWDWIDMTGRFVDGLARLRLLTGLTHAQEEEAAVRALLLNQQRTDGLFWNGPSEANGGYASEAVEIFSQSRGLLALVTWYALTGSAALEARIEAAVAALDRIAVHEDGTARYPGTQWRDGWLDYTNTAEGAPDGRAKWGLGALVALPLLEYHLRSGSRAARALADQLLAYFIDESGLVQPSGEFHGHVHAEGYAGLATAAVYQARLTGRDDRLRWAERVYRWIRAHGTRQGWIPDAMELPAQYYWYWYHVPWLPPTCETCALADVLQLAIALAETGYPEYWDDVERFARNHLLASQFPDATTFLPPAAHDTPGARALAGSFGSATLPNTLLGHLVTGAEPIVEGCCTGSGARALHLVWEHAVEDRAEGLYVHLGFSGDYGSAEVLSYEPYEGRREVWLRAPRKVLVRLPTHARRDEAELWVDGSRRAPLWRGAYADVGPVGPGQVVVLRYPLRREQEQLEVNRQMLAVDWKGGTVLDVRPAGAAPVPYQRAHLAQAATPWQAPPSYPRLAIRLSPLA
ncbi:MAG TPA: hypothetical protein VFB73_05365 [Chloroflexota bacterium]|nr:hypothetical protein [Chloroflexota bacterium]